ncbi:lipopolysaccharide biosynthesis protein [Atopococcus tabaci]|uniref:lipopolysaccharide biosynthesis protein n=1 Tax=Atopococcus tabaci TaxID=269774 RepID=UPI0004214226|nr:oligosaccharide flippase family protein [Atopococcus tabaci]
MNVKALSFFKNFSYTFVSNLITLVVSTLVTLIVPKLIGVEDYGYWQLYMFYSTYVGFFHFGWNDGIYLRYGGEEYESLDKPKFFSQFIQLLTLQVSLAALFMVGASFIADGPDRTFIFQMIAIDMVILNVRYMFLFILQATNRINKYAVIMVLDRVLFVGTVLFLLLIGSRDYHLMIAADLISKFVSLLYGMYACKEFVFLKLSEFTLDLKETWHNINVGVKLMIANLASKAIIGIVRFGIERRWDVETFGKVSLTLSISHFMMVFITGIGVVVYPILRRTNPEKLPSIYKLMRNFLMITSFSFLIFYYPARVILSAWLPEYAEALLYMALLFPLVIYEGRLTLLINTYMKTLRHEKVLLRINTISVTISTIATVFTTVILHNLNLAVLTILLGQMTRAILAEYFLSDRLNISLTKDIILETVLTVVFIASGWYIDSWWTVVIYGISYLIYLMIKMPDVKETYAGMKGLVGNK